MSKRRLEYLDLPTPKKRAKLNAGIDTGLYTFSDVGYARFTAEGTQYKEMPLMLPFALSGCFFPFLVSPHFKLTSCVVVLEIQQDGVNPLPLHNWNNLFFEYTHDSLHRASIQAVAETVQAITIEDRAVARFSGYIGYSRTVPFDYHTLPRSEQWITPVPFNNQELKVSKQNTPLYIDYQCIQGAYFPRRFFGLRQSFILYPTAHPWYKIRRGTKVVLGRVIGNDVAYFVTRVRFIRSSTAGVEVVGIKDDGSFHDDTSLSWPPFMLEVPVAIVDRLSFGDWVPSSTYHIVLIIVFWLTINLY